MELDSGVLQLASSPSRDLTKCIFCGKVKDGSGSKQLTSTEDGRNKIVSFSKVLEDNLLDGISDARLCDIKYHAKSCFSQYRQAKERKEKKRKSDTETTTDNPCSSMEVSMTERPKRGKIILSPMAYRDKP